MRVLLSVDTVRMPLTGIGRYVYELAARLTRDENIDAIYFHDWIEGLMTEEALLRRIEGEPASSIARNRTRASRVLRRLTSHVGRRLDLSGDQKGTRLPSNEQLVAHGPAFAMPPGDTPKVVTIADLSVIKYPHFHPPLRVEVISHDIRAATRKADHLLTFSEFTRRELIDELKCAPERVTAVPLAADASFTPRDAASTNNTLARYGLGWRRYCLSVGTIEPRKQIDTLLDAFIRIDPALQAQYPLVLIGDKGWLTAGTHARIAHLQAQGRAYYLGYVPQADLPMLYSAAAVCLFTSVYEGFGLPAVEAMASGVPLIAAAAASLPEVCGNGAAFVPPGDSDAIAQALVQLLSSPAFAADLASRGCTAASRFTWQRTTTQTVNVYRQLLHRE